MNWKNRIQLQIDRHRHLNLLSTPHTKHFSFINATREIIERVASNRFSEKEEQNLLRFTKEAVLSSLYRINQFYQFDKIAQGKLEKIYQQLLQDIKNQWRGDVSFDRLAKRHYLRLQQWLIESQPEILVLYPSSQPAIENEVVCAEYSPATQIQTLGIDHSKLTEPVLDLGCGRQYQLVKFLRVMGIDAYGVDRDVLQSKNVYRSSWLDYAFQPDYWGTIISHLGFSNHFMHHHLKAKSDHILYARKYVELLKALKVGGKFYYAPDLPFIETHLNANQYSLQKKQVPQTTFYTSAVQRLR